MRVDIPVGFTFCLEPALNVAVEEDCTGSLIIEVFDDSDKVGTDVILLHGCPKSCMSNPVEGLFEVYENMVVVFLVLEIFLTKDFQVQGLLDGVPFCSEACLFFGSGLLRLQFQSIQYDLQHDFAWVADEADRSVVLVLLQVAFLWKCDDQGLGLRG